MAWFNSLKPWQPAAYFHLQWCSLLGDGQERGCHHWSWCCRVAMPVVCQKVYLVLNSYQTSIWFVFFFFLHATVHVTLPGSEKNKHLGRFETITDTLNMHSPTGNIRYAAPKLRLWCFYSPAHPFMYSIYPQRCYMEQEEVQFVLKCDCKAHSMHGITRTLRRFGILH